MCVCSEYEKSSDIRTCPTFLPLCPTFLPETSDIMSDRKCSKCVYNLGECPMQHTQTSDTGPVDIGHNVRYSKLFFIYTVCVCVCVGLSVSVSVFLTT